MSRLRMSHSDWFTLKLLLAVIVVLGLFISAGMYAAKEVAAEQRAGFSAFVKTTGNKHDLTFEEWRASR